MEDSYALEDKMIRLVVVVTAIVAMGIIVYTFIFVPLSHERKAIEMVKQSDLYPDFGTNTDDAIIKALKETMGYYKIIGWKARKVGQDIYLVSFEIEDTSGVVVRAFEADTRYKIVRQVSNDEELESHYERYLGKNYNRLKLLNLPSISGNQQNHAFDSLWLSYDSIGSAGNQIWLKERFETIPGFKEIILDSLQARYDREINLPGHEFRPKAAHLDLEMRRILGSSH
jgi:hypothetical protein